MSLATKAPVIASRKRNTARRPLSALMLALAFLLGVCAGGAAGHAQDSLTRTYNRNAYVSEKREALERLAAHIMGIVNPPPSNVEQLPARRAR